MEIVLAQFSINHRGCTEWLWAGFVTSRTRKFVAFRVRATNTLSPPQDVATVCECVCLTGGSVGGKLDVRAQHTHSHTNDWTSALLDRNVCFSLCSSARQTNFGTTANWVQSVVRKSRCLSREPPLLATPNVFAGRPAMLWFFHSNSGQPLPIPTRTARHLSLIGFNALRPRLTFSPLISSSSSTSADTFWACRSTPGLRSTSQVSVGRGFPPSLTQARFSSEFSFTGTNKLLASRRRESISKYGGLGRSKGGGGWKEQIFN